MRYQGRVIDAVALWSNYVDFPANWNQGDDEFAPLVQCPNPDHQTTKRHFQVNLREPLVHCFANCGISGTYEHAISIVQGSTHRKARKEILKHSRVGGGDHRPVRKRRNLESPNAPSEILEYERYLPQAAVAYLKFRKISEASTSKWELGWDAESLRIVIPVHDSRGRVRLLVRRTIKPRVEPRYLYSEGVERNSLLFGIGQIDLGLVRSEGIILVEGTLDCIILHQYGFTNTVAILGSKVSEIQARKIANMRPTRVYTMFDADGAGVGATISARRRLPGNVIKVCRYPKGKTDPASLDEKEAHRVIQRAVTYSKFERATRIRSTRRRISVG